MHYIAKTCIVKAGLLHSIRRGFLRYAIPQLLKIFKQCPGLLGPQFPAALALLSLARTELEFYYLHRDQVPRRSGGWFSSQKRHDPAEWTDNKIVVLIGLAERLRHFCQQHAKIVTDYHALALRDVRHEEAVSNGGCVRDRKICTEDFEQVIDALENVTPESDVSNVRKAWYRCSSKINDGWKPKTE